MNQYEHSHHHYKIILDSHVATQLSSYFRMQYELQTLQSAIKIIIISNPIGDSRLEIQPNSPLKPDVNAYDKAVVLRALFVYSVTAYWRLFAEGESGQPKLNPSDVYGDIQEMLEVHKMIGDMRNNYFAHGNKNDYETFQSALFINPPPKFDPTIGTEGTKLHLPTIDELISFHRLVDHLLVRIEGKLQKTMKKLDDEIGDKVQFIFRAKAEGRVILNRKLDPTKDIPLEVKKPSSLPPRDVFE
jgi:hypothetical protein